MKRLLLATVLCGLFSLPSFAQANQMRRFEINWGVLSYMRLGSSDYGGGTLGFAYHPTERLAIVAESAVHEEIRLFSNKELITYTFGPRYKWKHGNRLSFFTEARAGGSRLNDKVVLFFSPPSTTATTTSVNGFAFGAGGGLDIGIRPWIAFRAAQAEYSFIHVAGNNRSGVRVGTGIVFRFGK